MSRRLVAALAVLCTPLPAIEIATGHMLGGKFDKRAFYVRDKGAWRKTYTGPAFRPEAAGRLMNLRIAQALFHDEWMTETKFDPDKLTDRVIAALDSYKAHGVLAITVSLQGGNMAYDREGSIKRVREYKAGPGKGSHVSAFRPDGSLKPEWMARCLRLARELDKRGMILNIMYLYAHQDELLAGPAAIDKAVANATDWLIDNNVRNVIIEIANEYDIKAWDHDRYVFTSMDKLIELVRSRFAAKKAKWSAPVTASATRIRTYENLRGGDLTAIHGNNVTPEQKVIQMKELLTDPLAPGPYYMNEDDNGRETTLVNLKKELDSCDAIWNGGGSWGYMPWVQLQIWPFRNVAPGASAAVRDDMPVEQRDAAYFKAVLEHIRGLVFAPK